MTPTRLLLAYPGTGDRSLHATPIGSLLSALGDEVICQTIGLPAGDSGSDATRVQTLGEALCASEAPDRTVIGGFSLGARMAAQLSLRVRVPGLLCLSYPFHRHGQPQAQHGLEVLGEVTTPTLIVQGTRDSHGNRQQVRGMGPLPANVAITWLDNGNHQWKVRGAAPLQVAARAEGAAPVQVAARAIRSFLAGLVSSPHV